ncbi:MAG: hypothetical protein J07HQW1_00721 [Haloquadratum walsbyi J07HQW1]|jgi:hypothetical protein|uniref:Uncharacterized protein n=1 Tax=Haloquadratum walsbyi J07HQW1 TaxID=1238424 RepID=U1MLV0_9EURY|nr:MAG: hypothetical protein J07HQW1_00721 [Haloquadratum walsbyi J07HQW1]
MSSEQQGPAQQLMDDGAGPNFAAFLLTVGGVTVVFIAVFIFAFPGTIGRFFAAAVVTVTIITLMLGMVLDLLGYFGSRASILVDSEEEQTANGVPDSVSRKPNKPLPKQINFDSEIKTLQEHFDGELPSQMNSFLTEYEQLKKSTSNRKVTAGSLRAALNPVQTIVDDTEMEELVDDMGDRLFRYIKSDPVDNIVVSEYAFYQDGNQKSVETLQAQKARIRATVHNQGEGAKAEVAVQFKNTDGVPVKTAYLPVGNLVPEGRKDLDTNVYIPSLATEADVFVIRATPDTEVLTM